jgi:hypothetical protein
MTDPLGQFQWGQASDPLPPDDAVPIDSIASDPNTGQLAAALGSHFAVRLKYMIADAIAQAVVQMSSSTASVVWKSLCTRVPVPTWWDVEMTMNNAVVWWDPKQSVDGINYDRAVGHFEIGIGPANFFYTPIMSNESGLRGDWLIELTDTVVHEFIHKWIGAGHDDKEINPNYPKNIHQDAIYSAAASITNGLTLEMLGGQ